MTESLENDRLSVIVGEETISPIKLNSRKTSTQSNNSNSTLPPITNNNINNSSIRSISTAASSRNELVSRGNETPVPIDNSTNSAGQQSTKAQSAAQSATQSAVQSAAPSSKHSSHSLKAPTPKALSPVKQVAVVQPPRKVYVKKNTVTQMINDLKHLLNLSSKISKPNFTISVKSMKDDGADSEYEEQFHSSILLARSNWIRRSWRNNLADETTKIPSIYTFNEELEKNKNQYSIGIKLLNEDVPEKISENFNFELEYNDAVDFEQIKAALKEFKKFIYTSDCNIREPISFLLVSLAELFQVDTLTEYLVKYFRDQLEKLEDSEKKVQDNLLQILEITYNYRSNPENKYSGSYKTNPDIDELLETCVRLVNKNGSKYVQDLKFQELSRKYPDLVLRLFCENPQ